MVGVRRHDVDGGAGLDGEQHVCVDAGHREPELPGGVWIRSAGQTADLYDRVEATTSVAFAINLPPPLTLTNLGADKTAPQNSERR